MLRTQDLLKITVLFGIVATGCLFFLTDLSTQYEDIGISTDLSEAEGLSDSLDNVEDIHQDVKDIEEELHESSGILEDLYILLVDGITTVLKLVFTSTVALITMVAGIFDTFEIGLIGLGIGTLILITILFAIFSAFHKWSL